MEAPQNLKAYLSPILLLKETGFYSGNFSEADITSTLEKISTADKNILVIDGINYSVSEAVDTLQQTTEQNWQHHHVIYSHKGLLNFLQKNVFERSSMEEARPFRYKPSFVQFVSPYFATSFQKVVSNLIKNKDLNTLKELMDFSGFIGHPYEAYAFQPLIDYLDTFLVEARELQTENLFPGEDQRQRLLSADLIAVLNNLPDFAVPLREEYLAILLSVYKNSFNQVSFDEWFEGWSMLKKIHGSNSQENEKEELEKQRPHKKAGKRFFPVINENTILWCIGIFCIVGILAIVSMLHKKAPEQEPEEVILSGTFGGREGGDYASFDEQLASSTNESNFRNFLSHLCRAHLQGRQRNIETGNSPFADLSTLPPTQGNSTVTIHNASSKDAVVLYFTSNNTLINQDSRLYSAFIGHGDDYTFSFDANFGRLNFAFGKKWMQLKDPMSFPLLKRPNPEPSGESTESDAVSFWSLKQFFLYPDHYTFYLDHYLTIQNFEQPSSRSNGAPFSKLLHEPSRDDFYSREPKHVDLTLSGSNVKITGKGNLYIYQSP